ncbi:MAG: hypothetical protein H0T84_11375 [Tatlockia sp.]|nr:hypothetical protein [Tatlockia sp.]
MQQKSEGLNSIDFLLAKQLQNILMNWILQNLNTLPFWFPQQSYTEFHQIKKIVTAEQRPNEIINNGKYLGSRLLSFLQNMKNQLKEDNDLYSLIHDIEKNINKACLGLINQNLLKALEKQYEEFFKKIASIKEESLSATTLNDMKQDAFAEKYQLRQSDFRRAKFTQHRIQALQILLLQPDNILLLAKPKPLSVIDWLDKKYYADLLFLLSIISARELENCLEHKATLYQEIVENLQNQAEQLSVHWQNQTSAIIRMYRILKFYQHWQATLGKTLGKLDIMQENDNDLVESEDSDWTTLSTFLRLFSYEKKTFFNEALKKENAIQIFGSLTNLVDNKRELTDPQKILNYLDLEKQKITTTIDEDKNRLLNKYPSWKKFIAFLGLALTEQPTYKIGMLGFDIGNDSIDSLENLQPEKAQVINDKINDWGNKLVPIWIQERLNPERDVKIIKNLAGLFCLLANQGVSSWLGYTYYFVAAINRVLFSQFDAWVSLGSIIGLDEIGLLENETPMRWLSGLGIHMLFLQHSDNWLPTFFSYIAATSASFGSAIVIEELIKNEVEDKEIFNPKAIAIGKFAIEAGIYSKVYSASFQKIVELQQATTQLTHAKALKIMGFYAQPLKRELQKRYHERARQYHYDKCINLCPDSETDVEIKTNNLDIDDLSCIESCKIKDQTMRDINQAYSYLKSWNP